MNAKPITSPRGSTQTPSFDRARVADVMRYGVISCSPADELKDVARTMVANHIHSVIIIEEQAGDGAAPWGVVSDIDVLATAHPGGVELMAGEAAATPAVMVGPEESLARAAQLMREHETSHLIVVDSRTGQPLGVISTLDVAGALASVEA